MYGWYSVLRWCLVVLRCPCAVDGTGCLSPVYCNFQTARHLSGLKVKWKTTDKVLLDMSYCYSGWVKYDGQMHQTKKESAVIQKTGNVPWICYSQKVGLNQNSIYMCSVIFWWWTVQRMVINWTYSHLPQGLPTKWHWNQGCHHIFFSIWC